MFQKQIGGILTITKKILAQRRHYVSPLKRNLTPTEEPLMLFSEWLAKAEKSGIQEPNAMHLATVDAKGRPHGRIVLLRQMYPAGAASPVKENLPAFVFYTNYLSAKGEQLATCKKAALTFWWEPLAYQVRIEGAVTEISPSLSDAYFAKRPRGHRIGAWASPQSSVLRDPHELEKSVASAERKFNDKEIRRPKHWGGFALVASYFEFWQGAPDRLHRRLCYVRRGNAWQTHYLAP